LAEVNVIAKKIHRLQHEYEVDIAVELSLDFAPLTEMWANGAAWDEMRHVSIYDEGDVVRALRRTVDLCRQLMRASGMPIKVVNACRAAEALIARDEVKEDY